MSAVLRLRAIALACFASSEVPAFVRVFLCEEHASFEVAPQVRKFYRNHRIMGFVILGFFPDAAGDLWRKEV